MITLYLSDDVAGDEGGDEREGEEVECEGEPVSGVHGLVAEEEVLLEVHRVDGVDDLKGGERADFFLLAREAFTYLCCEHQ